MLDVKRKPASISSANPSNEVHARRDPALVDPKTGPSKTNTTPAGLPERKNSPVSPPGSIEASRAFQTRRPVITGEIYFSGKLPVDGLITGQLEADNRCLRVRQRANGIHQSDPELEGEIRFKDMVRINGHIAGTIYSEKGTLIVDTGATVEANIDVAVAVVNGVVSGDVVGRERVEIGPMAKIYGNITTRSITIRHGGIFEGECRMIEDRKAS